MRLQKMTAAAFGIIKAALGSTLTTNLVPIVCFLGFNINNIFCANVVASLRNNHWSQVRLPGNDRKLNRRVSHSFTLNWRIIDNVGS